MPSLLAYSLLFTVVGAFFIFIHLMIGRLVRPMRMDAEKATIYECGEPTIGSSWIQFDLRFYVVALLFVIFDVEMAFFFPWAVVFGTATTLAKTDLPAEQRLENTAKLLPPHMWGPNEFRPADQLPREWKEFEKSVRETQGPLLTPVQLQKLNSDMSAGPQSGPGSPIKANLRDPSPAEQSRNAAEKFAWTGFLDILVFFGVLLVGFAYLWRRGDLDWVRSIAAQKAEVGQEPAVSDQNPEVSTVAV